MNIIKATSQHIPEMNEVILAAKSHWGYSQKMMDIWLPDLIVDEVVLASRHFWVLDTEGRIAGVFSVSVDSEQCCELEDFWVLPQMMGKGAGRIMFGFIQRWMQAQQVTELLIVSDPHAKGFYERMGAQEVGLQPSLPEGRKLPVMRYVRGLWPPANV